MIELLTQSRSLVTVEKGASPNAESQLNATAASVSVVECVDKERRWG